MTTLVLQCIGSAFAFLLGVQALRVAHSIRPAITVHQVSWMLTGLVFVLMGLSGAIQDLGAVLAFRSGQGTAVYEAYLRWSPAGNYGRAFLIIAFATLLILTRSTSDSADWRTAMRMLSVLIMANIAGGLVGAATGPVISAKHWSAAAVLDSIELVLLLFALLRGLTVSAMDRILWSCLSIYTFHSVLNVIWFSALAWLHIPGMWSPRPAEIALYTAATYFIVFCLVSYRLVLAQRGVQVPGLLDPPVNTRPSLVG